LAIEVGPLAHGCFNADLLEDTRTLVLTLLDSIEARNTAILTEAAAMAAERRSRAGSSNNDEEEDSGFAAAELDAFDAKTATYVPFCLAPKSIAGVHRSSYNDSSTGERLALEYYYMISPLKFPDDNASTTIDGTALGKRDILTANKQAGGATSKRKWIVHRDIDCTDWQPFAEGAPLFQAIDGSGEDIAFNRALHATSEAPAASVSPASATAATPLYPVFINEASYQSNNMVCWVTKDAKYVMY
jgi:hypothetical protein